jgi:hypothetical protein
MKVGWFDAEEWEKDYLEGKDLNFDIHFHEESLTPENSKEASEYDVVSVFVKSSVTEDVLKDFEGRMVACRSTGFDHVDTDYAASQGIAVCNVPRYGDNTVAEHTFGLILTLSRRIDKAIEKVEEGDAIQIGGAYTVEDDRGNAELRLGDEAQVKMAEDDEVPEVETQGSGEASKANIREIVSENTSYEITGMVMEVYTSNPFYNVDPDSGDTVREDDDGNYVTDDGDEVEEPESRLAISCVVDDGTDNIRVVLFRDQARKLLGVDEETEKEGDRDAVEDAAEEVIGKQIRVEGRARYNARISRTRSSELLKTPSPLFDTKCAN